MAVHLPVDTQPSPSVSFNYIPTWDTDMLTDTQVQQAEAHDRPYKMADGGGLYVHVLATGARIWRYDYRLHGKRATLTLGRYPDVTLTAARELHAAARELLARGESPAQAKQAKKAAAKQAARAAREAEAREKARERNPAAQIAAFDFRDKKITEFTAAEGVTYATVLTGIVTSALGAFADQFFDRLERSSARAPSGEETE